MMISNPTGSIGQRCVSAATVAGAFDPGDDGDAQFLSICRAQSQPDLPRRMPHGSATHQPVAASRGSMIFVEVRACDGDDLEQLRRRWPTPADVAASHYAEQERGRASFLVAWRDDEPLGWLVIEWDGCVGPNARAAFPASAEVIHLHVRREHRRKGVGTALVGAAEAAIAARDLSTATISVSLENPDAARLYERCGYRHTGVTDVCDYDWMDGAGATHHAHEVNELLIKRLCNGRYGAT
jgi:ribosomal protein S18 acetylase RimI-like enzyme